MPHIAGSAAGNAVDGYPLACVVLPNGASGAESFWYCYLEGGSDAIAGLRRSELIVERHHRPHCGPELIDRDPVGEWVGYTPF